MKIYLLFFTTILSLVSIGQLNIKKGANDWNKLNLKGKVKSITEKATGNLTYKDPSTGKVTSIKIDETTEPYLFDKRGFKTKSIIEGDPDMSKTFEYDEKERLIKDNIYTKKNLLRYNTYNYDENGLLIEIKSYLHYRETSIKDSNYRLDLKTIILNDYNGYRIKDWEYDGDKIRGIVLYKNDSNGNVIERNIFTSEDKLRSKMNFVYDANQNLIEISIFSDGFISPKIIYEYDKKGNKILEVKDGLKQVYRYDQYGNVIEYFVYNLKEGNSVTRHSETKYFYDNFSNWIKKVDQSELGVITTERTLMYY